ncbi:MAG: polysaccharide deacetylase family protein [Novosphingobium sp.]
MRAITDLPDKRSIARFPRDFGQRFILTVDTEEEFDWGATFSREGHGLRHIPELARFQTFCEERGVVPLYLVDYPIATSPLAAEILGKPLAEGKAEIGVQLHPWVNPPFTEEVNDYNSFAGNLPDDLEREKLLILRDTIAQNFHCAPVAYRAGRYGLGPRTGQFLKEAGIGVDTSVRARFDYSASHGRNYRDHPTNPYLVDGSDHTLLELPLTTVFTGPLRRIGRKLYPSLWRTPQIRGLLAHLRLMDRIPLTPEGVEIREAMRGANAAIAKGLPVLVTSFHSPSLSPGHTPYVRTDADLEALYAWWDDMIKHLKARGVQPTSVKEILASVEH